MQNIRTEEQFEQLLDSIQPEVITTDNKPVRSASQKLKSLIDYVEIEKPKQPNTNRPIK